MNRYTIGLLALLGLATSMASVSAAPAVPSSPASAVAPSPAMALVCQMRLGWNLGNSLDAVGGETAWGNPKVTPELLRSVKAAGFGAVRIPVTWSGHFGPGPDFRIDAAWLDRVAQVVGYALDAGLYAIINLHHDGKEGGTGEWLALDDADGEYSPEHSEAVKAQFLAIWKQIAGRLRDVDSRLLFESMNEIHVGYGESLDVYHYDINDLNQAFVDLVRSSGGTNAARFLVLPGYNTNIRETVKGFKLPVDAIPGHLIVSCHFYDPWRFSINAEEHTWVDGEGDILEAFNLLKASYIDRGIPVILGEYGATFQRGYEPYRRYYAEFVTKAAHDRGIVPFWWDNGSRSSGPESFGLFDRKTGAIIQKSLVEALLRAATSGYAIGEIQKPGEKSQ